VDEESLRQAVEAQAKARVGGDLATFASFMTPQAVLQLYAVEGRNTTATPKRFEIVDITATEEAGASVVRYRGGGSYVLHTAWQHRNGVWKAVAARIPTGSVRAPLWRRIFGLGAADRGLAAEPREPR
jgi:hypothetical protein